jgi:hypothetical protein
MTESFFSQCALSEAGGEPTDDRKVQSPGAQPLGFEQVYSWVSQMDSVPTAAASFANDILNSSVVPRIDVVIFPARGPEGWNEVQNVPVALVRYNENLGMQGRLEPATRPLLSPPCFLRQRTRHKEHDVDLGDNSMKLPAVLVTVPVCPSSEFCAPCGFR